MNIRLAGKKNKRRSPDPRLFEVVKANFLRVHFFPLSLFLCSLLPPHLFSPSQYCIVTHPENHIFFVSVGNKGKKNPDNRSESLNNNQGKGLYIT